MRWLPMVKIGPAQWLLPLCDATSLALESILLRAEGREQPLAALFARDPSLALWARCHFPNSETCDELATRIAPYLPALLSGDDRGQKSEVRSQRSEVRDYQSENRDRCPAGSDCSSLADDATTEILAELAARAVMLAHAARQAAEPAMKEAAFLGAMFHDAASWLTPNDEDAPRDIDRHAIRQAILAEHLSLPAEVVAIVNNAIQGLPTYQLPSATYSEILSHWRVVDPATHLRLPQVAARIARLELLETDFARTLETEKLESLKQLAYGAGHEINNPLANISLRAQTLLKQESDPERRRILAAINSQVFRAHEMIADLMLFARPPKLQLQPVELAPLVNRVIEELREETTARSATIEFSPRSVNGSNGSPPSGRGQGREPIHQPIIAQADPIQLAIALRALCQNALEATGLGGHIDVKLQAGDVSPLADSCAQIVVADNGPGISPAVRSHLFDPFYSGREAGRGLGFGLTKTWRIVADHGGHIDVKSNGHGATFTISLPIE